MGAWIEISSNPLNFSKARVAPLVGAWIEIVKTGFDNVKNKSLPSWERGLKCGKARADGMPISRSPRGSVD